jgi:hypothetical protein
MHRCYLKRMLCQDHRDLENAGLHKPAKPSSPYRERKIKRKKTGKRRSRGKHNFVKEDEEKVRLETLAGVACKILP